MTNQFTYIPRTLSIITVLCTLNLATLPQTSHAACVLPARNLLVLPQSETATAMALLWDKPVEHENLAGYEVYQNGARVATTPPDQTFYGATNLAPGTSYAFYVVAKDAGNNRSEPSPTVKASTRLKGVILDVSAAPYNAKGDGTTKNTAAIQKAIDDCPAGGTVKIPAGTFLSGALVLKSNMFFYVASGGVLKGSTDTNDYLPMIWTRYMGVEAWCFQPLIRVGVMDHNAGYTTQNVTLYGEGEIRGGGDALALQESYDHRSRLVLIQNCRNVAIMGLHLTYPGGWTVHPLYSDNITGWNIWVESWDAPQGHSGDGFDPDSCSNVYLVNSVLHTWDNAFGPKSGRGLEGYQIGRPTKHVRAVGCTFQSSAYGPPCIGSEVSGGIEDVVIRDSKFDGTQFQFRTNDGRGAFIRNFLMEDVEFTRNSSRSIYVWTSCPYRNNFPKAPPYTTCNDFVFRNLTGCGSIIIEGGFGLTNGLARQFYVHNVSFDNVQLTKGKNIEMQYCDNVQFNNVRRADGTQPTYTLTGTNYDISRDNVTLTQ
jgi:polygalacturonase